MSSTKTELTWTEGSIDLDFGGFKRTTDAYLCGLVAVHQVRDGWFRITHVPTGNCFPWPFISLPSESKAKAIAERIAREFRLDIDDRHEFVKQNQAAWKRLVADHE